jgi:hypothetical protein
VPRAHFWIISPCPSEFLPKMKLKNLTCPSLPSVWFSLLGPSSLRFSLSETLSPFLPLGLYLRLSLNPFVLSPLSQNLPLSQTQSLSIPSLSQLRSPEAKILTLSPLTSLQQFASSSTITYVHLFIYLFFMLGVRVLACW